jgi:sulfate permease, SulP family
LFGAAIGKIALSALAGLLMVVGFQTIKFREINKIARTSKRALWLMVATFAATLIVLLQWAIFFGVAASFVVFAYRESESTTIVEVVPHEGGVPIE